MAESRSSSSRSRSSTSGTSKKSAGKRPSAESQAGSRAGSNGSGGDDRAERVRRSTRRPATELAAAAAQQLAELTGKEPEGVTGLSRSDDGWLVQVDVVELRRVPATTDVIASYEVELDDDGALTGYRRTRRYGRGDVREE